MPLSVHSTWCLQLDQKVPNKKSFYAGYFLSWFYVTGLGLPPLRTQGGALMKRHWKDSFCSMDPRVDEDHRALFKLLDQVSTHRRDSDIEDLNPLLDRLLEYTFDHFAREEKTMEACGYPQHAHHSNEHLAMRKSFIDSLRQVVKGTMAIPVFIRHVKESFTYHFETEDMLFICWQQHTVRESRRPDSTMVGG